MTMTLILHTQMGLYASGSVLYVSATDQSIWSKSRCTFSTIRSILNIFPQGTTSNGGIGSGVTVGKHRRYL